MVFIHDMTVSSEVNSRKLSYFSKGNWTVLKELNLGFFLITKIITLFRIKEYSF